MRKIVVVALLLLLVVSVRCVPGRVSANEPQVEVAGVFGNSAGEYAVLTVEYDTVLKIEQRSREYETRIEYFDNVYPVTRVVAVACGNYVYMATEGYGAQSYVFETVASWPCGQQYIVYMPLVKGE
jgi:hypothetical protein